MIKASYSDKKKVIDILWNSFINLRFPNSINFVVKQDRKRPIRLRYLMEYQFNVAFKFGEIWLSDNKKGCILLLFPEKRKFSFSQLFGDIRLVLYCIGIKNVLKVLKRESQLKRYHPKTPFVHFWLMAITPESQGKGIGQKLLQQVLERYQNCTKSFYLETTTPSNLKFYTKNGFTICDSTDALDYPLYFLRYD